MKYPDALDFLVPRTTTIKFGLKTTRALLREVGDPQHVFASVHIGGTNGKGSSAALVAEALSEAGHRVGLYTSPHLVSFRERIRVDGRAISEAAVAAWTARLRPLIERRGATFFEATTAIAFADFAARGVEIAVVEVGLGGRLDSTNVLRPLASGVCHVALDHQKYLGDSLEQIAREKAGIAKPGVPFIVGEADPGLAEILALEAWRGTSGLRRGPGASARPPDIRIVPAGKEWTSPLALRGPHQRRNAAFAAALLEVLPGRYRPADAAVRAGFARARVPGRYDKRGQWLFDVAHNPDGVAGLLATLRTDPPPRPLHALVSILGDKDWPSMLVELDRAVDVGILTVAPSADVRRWDLDWLERWLKRPDRPPARAEWHLVPDFLRALARAEEGAGTVLVTGSFHTVGDVMQVLGYDPT
ncbi:MAG: bifunctional folylpolyglutamate synthase/dihydrofolate synthase [Gemmatimonadales bacterium]